MARVQAVTFDLAGTLLFPHPSVGSGYSACAKAHGVAIEAGVLDAAFPLAFKGGPKNAQPEVFWREVVLRCFGPALPSAKSEAVFRSCWDAFAQPEAWRLAPGSLQAISAIRFLGVRVGVLSNADSRMRRVLEGHGLMKHLDGVFLSEETGYAKPDARAFGQAARALGGATSGLVHFGDSPTEDGEGARDAGATGVVVGGAHAPERCLRNERISEAPMRSAPS
jgi:putative hydrolase of the HAD superfamily